MILDYYPFPLMSTHNGVPSAEVMSLDFPFLQIIEILVKERGYKDLLEIGTHKGQTTWLLNKLAQINNGTLTTVDPKPQITMKNLHHTNIVHEKSEDFWRTSGKYDFILIDGDHSFDACMNDALNAVARINQGGLIAFHDTLTMDGVIKTVDQLKCDWAEQEWVHFNIGKGMSIVTIEKLP